MGHTNSTANLSLPQFIGTDKPTWLGDVNGAMSAIDAYAGTNDAAVAAVDAKADGAVSDAAGAVATATAANNTAGAASTTATNAYNLANNALTVANNADGHTNQLETKVGLLADLHTTDKTSIVNAINEVKDAEGDLTTLATTDKTSLVAAINEVAQGSGVFSNAVRYNDVTQELEYWDGSSWISLGGITPGSTTKCAIVYQKAWSGADTSLEIIYLTVSLNGSEIAYVSIDHTEVNAGDDSSAALYSGYGLATGSNQEFVANYAGSIMHTYPNGKYKVMSIPATDTTADIIAAGLPINVSDFLDGDGSDVQVPSSSAQKIIMITYVSV